MYLMPSNCTLKKMVKMVNTRSFKFYLKIFKKLILGHNLIRKIKKPSTNFQNTPEGMLLAKL